jgi:predicted peroxiredoxin/TusA-related sulfurtransferase
MTTAQKARVEVSGTWKPYRVIYEIIKAQRELGPGAVVEVVAKDDEGILADVRTWCATTGQELIAVQRQPAGRACLVVRPGERKASPKSMTVIVSTASLEYVVFPLEKALAAAVLGMDVYVVFEGAGVRLLQRGYRPRVSGLAGRFFTPMVERVMREQIGWPLPPESIAILEDLGARFYVCGPSMVGYGVPESELTVSKYTLGAVVTWAGLLARTDVHVFSKAQFEKP